MNRWRRIQIGLGISGAASLGMMIPGLGGKPASFILAIWVVAAVWLMLRCESRLRQAKHDALLIRTINHHRHDWMNDLQVLFGYISLRRFDIVPVYVDKIKAKLTSESGISKLGINSLIVFLLSFRTHKRSLTLEVDIEEEIFLPTLPINAEAVASVICETIELYNDMALEPEGYAEEGNVLSLQLVLEDDALLLDFVYNGGYADGLEQRLRALLARRTVSRDAELELTEQHAVVTIRVPLQSKRVKADYVC